MSLIGKVAVVTGSGQGLGRGIALRLATEGADVAVLDKDAKSADATAEDIRKLGRRSLAITMDVSIIPQIQPALDAVVREFGVIDIWVNNAGVGHTKPMLEITEAEWDSVLDVNCKGTFFCTQTAGRQMAQQRSGLIVNITAGPRPRPLAAHYAASKMAIDSITKTAALSLVSFNVRVNAIDPGLVLDTPMVRAMDADRVRTLGMKPGESIEQWVASIPMGRMGTLDEMGGIVAFLASKDGTFITGQIIAATGGMDLAGAAKTLQPTRSS